jgi:hypothetical protein
MKYFHYFNLCFGETVLPQCNYEDFSILKKIDYYKVRTYSKAIFSIVCNLPRHNSCMQFKMKLYVTHAPWQILYTVKNLHLQLAAYIFKVPFGRDEKYLKRNSAEYYRIYSILLLHCRKI